MTQATFLIHAFINFLRIECKVFSSYSPPFSKSSYIPSTSLPTKLHILHLPCQDCIQFMLGNYSWVWGLPTVWLVYTMSLKKTDSSSSRSNKMPVASQLREELHSLLPFPCEDLICLPPVEVLSMLSVVVSSYVHLPCWVWKTPLLWCYSSPLVLRIFLYFLHHI